MTGPAATVHDLATQTGASNDLVRLLLVAGLGEPEWDHWQSRWRRLFWDCRLVEQEKWDTPDRDSWVKSLLAAIREQPDSFIVAHSLGCAAVAHAVARWPDMPVRGALLVCPADVEYPSHTPDSVRSFAPLPMQRFPFPATVAASETDPFVELVRAKFFAVSWGARFVNVGPCGHINVAAGFGPWPRGTELLMDLVQYARQRQQWLESTLARCAK